MRRNPALPPPTPPPLASAMGGCPVHSLRGKLRRAQTAADPPARRARLAAVWQRRPPCHGRNAVRGGRAMKVPVSLATVYNTLHQFTEAGLLERNRGRGLARLFRHQRDAAPSFPDRGNQRAGRHSQRRKSPSPACRSRPRGREIARVDVIVRIKRRADPGSLSRLRHCERSEAIHGPRRRPTIARSASAFVRRVPRKEGQIEVPVRIASCLDHARACLRDG